MRARDTAKYTVARKAVRLSGKCSTGKLARECSPDRVRRQCEFASATAGGFEWTKKKKQKQKSKASRGVGRVTRSFGWVTGSEGA